MSNKSIQEREPGEHKSVIEALTAGVILEIAYAMEGIARQYLEMSEDDVLQYILSKKWYYVPKVHELPSWRDWFVIIAKNRVIEFFCCESYKLTGKELKIVDNAIYEMMDEFRSWKHRGGYYRHRIGYGV